MNSYTIPSFSFFLFFFFFAFIKAATPQPSSSSCCSTQFQCGNLTGIGYPFWGNSRSSSCGKPEFELNCDQNNITQMQIMSNTYRVLSVLPQNQTIRIARMDLWENICPSSPNDTPKNLNYSISSTRIMSLLYGCPVSNVTYPNLFTCSDSNQTTDTYLLNNSMSSNQRTTFQNACQVEIQVPILQSAFNGLMSDDVAIWDVFREGFDLLYDAENSKCNSCKSSGEECGYEWATNETVCAGTNYVCTAVAPGRPKNRTIQTSPPINGGEPVSSPFPSGGGEPVSNPSPSGGGGPVSSPSPSGGNVKVIVGIAASVGGTLVIAAVGIIIFCHLRKKKTSKNPENLEEFLKTHGALALRRYKYSDVKKMTDSFQDKLGQGGFGSVYKGKLLDGRMVAVKVLNETKGNGNEFINEVASISRTSHVNIVALLGFCVEGSKRALIYEYVPNGSLEKFIYVENPLEADSHLGWETLYKIAIGIAYGLEYLHRGCYIRILHFDIKPHNILLDEDFNPKISDFGLAKLCVGKDSMVSMTGARGTAGYIAPEVVSRNFGGVSHKADVYSYGMMLLEMVGGRKNLNVRVTNLSEIYFPQWIYKRLDLNEDLGLYGVTTIEEEEIARKMILVGLWCIQMDPSDRPAMSKVLEMLEGSLQALQIPPKPFISSPAREEGHSSTTSIS